MGESDTSQEMNVFSQGPLSFNNGAALQADDININIKMGNQCSSRSRHGENEGENVGW